MLLFCFLGFFGRSFGLGLLGRRFLGWLLGFLGRLLSLLCCLLGSLFTLLWRLWLLSGFLFGRLLGSLC